MILIIYDYPQAGCLIGARAIVRLPWCQRNNPRFGLCEATLKCKIYPGASEATLDGIGKNRPVPGGRLNKKDGLTRYGNSHVKDKTSYRPSYL